MGKNSFIFNFDQWPKGFLLALLLIFIVAIAAGAVDIYFYNPPYHGLRMKVKNEHSLKKGHSYDVLIFGDCYSIHGIIPSVIEKGTGLSVFNFSTHAMHTVAASKYMFQNYLGATTINPKYLVIGYLPQVYGQTREDISKYSMVYLYDFNKGNFFKIMSDFGVMPALKFLVPYIRHQEYLTHMKNMPNFKDIDQFVRQVIFEEKGYFPWNAGRVYDGHFEDKRYEKYPVSDFFQENIQKIIQLANARNVRVIYIVPSKPLDRYEWDEKNGLSESYKTFLDTLQKEYPDIIVLNLQEVLNERDIYADFEHLNGKGAAILSQYLSDEINRQENKLGLTMQVH